MSDTSNGWEGSSLDDIFNNRDIWFEHNNELKASYNHTVLFYLPLPQQPDKLPIAHRGDVIWDQDFVRFPSSDKSQYAEIDDAGKTVLKSRWDLIEQSLLKSFHSSRELEQAIKQYNTRYEDHWNFATFHELFEVHFSPAKSAEYFIEVIPKIINLALQLPQLIQCAIPLLKQGMNHSISLTQQQIACLLANAFLCTFPRRNTDKKSSEYANYPSINFNKLYGLQGQNVIEKLLCICNYFERVTLKMPVNIVTFQRRSLKVPFEWESSEVHVSRTKFHITSNGKIEEGNGMLQVDFANRFVGGGVLGYGCVQEEIRFVINPEMIVSRLFTECLGDEEALTMIGCEQFNAYHGYANTFRWAGNFQDSTPLDTYRRRKCKVVAIDALSYKNDYEQFKEGKFRRELSKAYAGFYSDGSNGKEPVATGFWGCGAFKGNIIKSALIQIMVCAVAHRNIVFFTVGDDIVRNEVAEVYKFLVEKDVSVGLLYRTLRKYRFDSQPRHLLRFIKKEVTSAATNIKPQVQRVYRPQNNLQQTSMFNFVIPSSTSSLSSIQKHEDDVQQSTQEHESCSSSRGSRDKQKFEEIENRFVMKKHTTEKPKKMSLIDSLDMTFDAEMSSSKTASKTNFDGF